MKILFSISYYAPHVSGLTICAQRLAEALAANGYEIEVVCLKHDPGLDTQSEIKKVKVTRLEPTLRLGKALWANSWLFKTWSMVARNDVVIVNLPQFEGLITTILAKMIGRRVFVLYHCELTMPPGVINKILETVANLSAWVTCFLADKIVVYTMDYGNQAKSLSGLRAKMVEIYPLVPRYEVKGKKKSGAIVLGVAARVAAEKGIEYLIWAVDDLISTGKKIEIKIAGTIDVSGEEKYKEKIDALIKTRPWVKLLGTQNQNEMTAFYQQIDALILPSVNSTEAFGLVQVEAMLSGVPVVASDLPGVRIPIQRTGMGILSKPADKSDLKRAIGLVLENKIILAKKVDLVKKEFDPSKIVDLWKDLLETINPVDFS